MSDSQQPDSFQETTSTSWLQRIQNSIAGIGVGLALFGGMITLLTWNEGRAVQTARSLAEGAGLVVSVPNTRVDSANQGKLIHATGPVKVAGRREDRAFGVSSEGVRLEREVEMYQWVEKKETKTRKKLGGGEETVTTYSYVREWSRKPINHTSFRQPQGRQNPEMTYRDQAITAEKGDLGAFELDGSVLSRIGGAQPFPVTDVSAEAIRRAMGGNRRVTLQDGKIFVGYDPSRPEVGDYRVSYRVVPVGPITVVGRQSGKGFAAYQTKAGDSLLMVRRGEQSAETVFKDAQKSNRTLTWILRAVGLVGMFIGVTMLLAPLGVVADVIPFLGSIVRLGTGFAALLVTAVVGSLTIAIAWLYYRPIVGIAVLLVGAAVAAFAVKRGRQRAAPAKAQPA
ncbi:MAG: TMEM43 family protein [Hyphomicrobiaceae bacterium]